MSKGYIILAQDTKKENYLRMAYALALSIKNTQSTVNKVCLATDIDKSLLPKKYLEVFDDIVPIPWQDHASDSKWKIENTWKFYYMTPYDETVVLDADMLFPADVSHWWDILSKQDVWVTTRPRTFKGDLITSTKYRQVHVSNSLPHFYIAFFYFKKSTLAAELFRMTNIIFNNWERFYFEFLDDTRPKYNSGDVAYALAMKILGIENECTSKILDIPTFVHMKGHLQGISEKLIGEDWTKSLPTYFHEDGSFKIGNYQQIYPFHYHIKSWLTDEMIEILEKRVDL